MPLPYNERTHDCGALRAGDAGRTVPLAGWVDNFCDLGGMLFFAEAVLRKWFGGPARPMTAGTTPKASQGVSR